MILLNNVIDNDYHLSKLERGQTAYERSSSHIAVCLFYRHDLFTAISERLLKQYGICEWKNIQPAAKRVGARNSGFDGIPAHGLSSQQQHRH